MFDRANGLISAPSNRLASRTHTTCALMLPAVFCIGAVVTGCGGGSTSTASSSTSSSSITSPTAPTTTTTTLQTCAAWAAQQKGTGVPAAIGSASSQRDALYAAGGGIKAVSGKYYAAYFPSGYAKRRIMVSLHGTGGSPEAEWTDWKTTISSYNWGFLGLKYLDDSTGSYDDDQTIYSHIKTMVDDVRASCDLGTVSMFLVGFSRGSAEAFPVHYLDSKDRRLFSAAGNNSGAWLLGGSPTQVLMDVQGRNDRTAMSGTKFWMYCGGQDFEHGYPMCDEMTQAKTWVQTYGGAVSTLYQDPSGTHGGLVRNSTAIAQMVSYFESLP